MERLRRDAEARKAEMELTDTEWEVRNDQPPAARYRSNLGQMPVPSGANQIVYSPQQVSSQADCAAKGGQLFDSQRLCCVRTDPYTGKPDPKRADDYGWYCAQTTFGAAVPAAYPGMPAPPPGAAPYYPPVASASMLGSLPPWLPFAVVAAGALFLINQQRKDA